MPAEPARPRSRSPVRQEDAFELDVLAFDRVRYNKVYGFMRRALVKLEADRRGRALNDVEQAFLDEALKDLRTVSAVDAYRSLSPDVYESNFSAFAWFRRYLLSRTRGGRVVLTKPWFNGVQALLTYQGSWGVLRMSGRKHLPLNDLAAEVDNHPDFQHLARLFERWWGERLHAYPGIQHWVWSFELCAASARESGDEVRVHAHVTWRSKPSEPVVIRQSLDLAFMGSLPVVSHASSKGRGGRAQNYQSFFYLQVPKIGAIRSVANIQPYSGYAVNTDWVYNWLAGRKITVETAKEVAFLACRNMKRHVEVLEAIHKEERHRALEEEVLRLRLLLRKESKPFRVIPAVTEWLNLYRFDQRRYPFLVLEGPSRMGKTAFAESLVEEGSCFNVDCSSATEPELRQFDSNRHRMLLFDEATPQLVIRSKRLFQSPSNWVRLGQSATNVNSYQVWAHKVPMVITSNTWSSEVARMPALDADWLRQNAIVIDVRAPLWLETTSAEPLARSQ